MRTPYKSPKPALLLSDEEIQKIAKELLQNKELFQNQQKIAIKIKELRIKKGYAYQFVTGAVEDMWFPEGRGPWPINHQLYRAIGEAICREAARRLTEPFEYPWSD